MDGPLHILHALAPFFTIISTYMCVNLYIILCTNLIKHTKKRIWFKGFDKMILWFHATIIHKRSLHLTHPLIRNKKNTHIWKSIFHLSILIQFLIAYILFKRSFINIMLLQFLYFPVDFTSKKKYNKNCIYFFWPFIWFPHTIKKSLHSIIISFDFNLSPV